MKYIIIFNSVLCVLMLNSYNKKNERERRTHLMEMGIVERHLVSRIDLMIINSAENNDFGMVSVSQVLELQNIAESNDLVLSYSGIINQVDDSQASVDFLSAKLYLISHKYDNPIAIQIWPKKL